METTESTTSKNLPSTDKWQDLYHRAEGWQSNLAFHRDELRFFNRILDKYFILLISDTKLDEMRKMTVDIAHKEYEVQKLTAEFKTLFRNIGEFIDRKSNHNEEALRQDFNALERDCNEFDTSFKELKTLVFKITEHMLESEKLKRFLKA